MLTLLPLRSRPDNRASPFQMWRESNSIYDSRHRHPLGNEQAQPRPCGWFALLAPVATPKATVENLSDAKRVLAERAVRRRMQALGVYPG